MRQHAQTRTVELSGHDGRGVVPGAEAIEVLRRAGLREAEAVQRVLAAEVVELPRPAPRPGAAVPSHPFFGRTEQVRILTEWLAPHSKAVAVVIGGAGVRETPLLSHIFPPAGPPTLRRRPRSPHHGHSPPSS